MESQPSRAKRSISAYADQGLSAALSRSARCALVYLLVSVICASKLNGRQNEKAGSGSSLRPRLPAFVFGFDFCLWALPYPVYVSGTATHALQRQHFAATRPED